MFLFHNDYNENCHPEILKALQLSVGEQMPGYGMDDYCKQAADLIREECANAELAVHFLVGGTQTNLTVIAAALRPHQCVIGAESAHIHVHETGSIEATGHKIIALPSVDGKITVDQIRNIVIEQRESADAEHIAQPKMVYLSNPTEFGTTYKLAELESISSYCKENRLYLFVDGARLGYGLAAIDNDVTLQNYASLCDAFYIGGTKVGAMFGEAVVISNPDIAEDFRYLIKQKGGMLAKGWLLGIQFKTLFKDGLYYTISKHADRLADKIREALNDSGFPLYLEGTTNQIFVKLPNSMLETLGKEFTYAVWEKGENSTVVRFCTSWATKEENVDALCNAIRSYSVAV